MRKSLVPVMSVLGLAMLAGLALVGQTKPDVRQLRGPQRDPVAIAVLLLGGKPVLASLGAGLELDTTTNPPVLRAVSSQTRSYKLARASDGTWTLPQGCSTLVSLYRNGLRQWDGEDFSVVAQSVRFRSGADVTDPSLADDLVVCDCR